MAISDRDVNSSEVLNLSEIRVQKRPPAITITGATVLANDSVGLG